MKELERFWIRARNAFLPKSQEAPSVMDLYRRRALIQAGLGGAGLSVLIILLDGSRLPAWQTASAIFVLLLIPAAVIWLFQQTGRLQLCARLWLGFYTALLAWAQFAAQSVYALYWLWLPSLIIFSVLILGLGEGAFFTVILTGVFWWVFDQNLQHGHSLGRFPDKASLLLSMGLHIVCVQLSLHALMTSYDAIRNHTELRAVMLRYSDEEAGRLAAVGERMGKLAQDMSEELQRLQAELGSLSQLARRSDTRVEVLQKELQLWQERTQRMREMSCISNG